MDDYKDQLTATMKDKELYQQTTSKLENDLHKVEAERDKLALKV